MKQLTVKNILLLSLLFVFGVAGAAWASETSPTNLTTEQWRGHSFTFLALPADKQAAGYEFFPVDQAERGFQGDRTVRISYDGYVGKDVIVTELIAFPAGYNQHEYLVYLTVKDTGEKLVGRTMRGQLEGVVLTADLVNAKEQFLGKVVYPKFRELSGVYVPNVNTMSATVPASIGGPATVVDVYTGNQSQDPIWLVLSINGEKAILPIAYSWTNIPVSSWTEIPPWQEALFTEDPRISFGWSLDAWNKIESGIVEEGMTKEQIRLSWGKPVRMEDDDMSWIYGTKKLGFTGDVLHSIETVE
ncbi:hypothetical protein [Pelosinus propionicus]|uniref:Uncharacterized protein n=1 Tax=Pelosinus propionicus DSM 13327 TaxID=1123291 RepID=A0A1I4I8G8_9FIRM|nr:hypothetical protein [Pelosinus propionicus]SFL50679.1 hypothetical protein SAMN04490355_100743 [Pelosinus propionicus DSM 13327]